MFEARKVRADLFVGHNPGLLPITWKIARDCGAKCGFDAEDFYSGMKRIGERSSLQDRIVADWENEHLTRYDYLSAAAPLIAREYMGRFSISFDTVVLNAFKPIRRVERIARIDDSTLSLYWISQTIGAHRGLENVVRALGFLKETPVRVFLRGDWQNGYEARLRMIADDLHVPQHMIISLPRVAYDEIVSSAAPYDVGLAIEEPTSRNHELCVPNKMLMYLSAGLAVAATGTPGQIEVMKKIPGAGFVFPWDDPESLARNLSVWVENPDLLVKAKAAALRAAREHFNWAHERTKLRSVVGSLLQ